MILEMGIHTPRNYWRSLSKSTYYDGEANDDDGEANGDDDGDGCVWRDISPRALRREPRRAGGPFPLRFSREGNCVGVARGSSLQGSEWGSAIRWSDCRPEVCVWVGGRAGGWVWFAGA